MDHSGKLATVSMQLTQASTYSAHHRSRELVLEACNDKLTLVRTVLYRLEPKQWL